MTIRNRHGWRPGTKMTVEETPDGVLLKPAPLFASTRPDQVFGCLPWQGEPKTLDQMAAGSTAAVRQRHDRSRY